MEGSIPPHFDDVSSRYLIYRTPGANAIESCYMLLTRDAQEAKLFTATTFRAACLLFSESTCQILYKWLVVDWSWMDRESIGCGGRMNR